MTAQQRLQQLATDWAQSSGCCTALFVYGSAARPSLSPAGDLDLACIALAGVAPSEVLSSFETALRNRGIAVLFSARSGTRGLRTYWVGASPDRVDLLVAEDPSDLDWIVDAIDVEAPRLSLLWAVEPNRYRDLQNRAVMARNQGEELARNALATEEIEKFLVAFDAASRAHAESDGYRFYFQYNLALGRLARIVQLTRRGAYSLYLPRDLMASAMSLEEQVQFRKLGGTLYLPEAAAKKNLISEAFLVAVQEAQRILGLDVDVSSIGGFLTQVIRRDYFLNVRDISIHCGGTILPGRLLRASALARYTGSPELKDLFLREQVTDVVDLRLPREVEKMPYSEDDLRGTNYFACPVSADPQDGEHSTYIQQLLSNRESLAKAMRVLLVAKGATIIHCHAGKDRTGWVCALIQLLCNAQQEHIMRDYMASRSDVSPEKIGGFIAEVRNRGGAVEVLTAAGLALSEVEGLRLRFAADHPHAGEQAT